VVVADIGCDSQARRKFMKCRGAKQVIPKKEIVKQGTIILIEQFTDIVI